MRYYVIVLFLFFAEFLLARNEVSVFDYQVQLEDDVYTTLSEVMKRVPQNNE